MSIIKICGVVIICLCAGQLFKSGKSAYGYICALAGTVIITAYCITTTAGDAVQVISSAAEKSGFSEYAEVLLKALGVSYLAVLTSDICKGAGDEMLSNAVVMAGKAEILLLCLPMISKLISIAAGLL